MKKISLLTIWLLSVASTLTLTAQTPAAASSADDEPGVQYAGVNEFSLGGSGASNTDMDNSFGGLEFSYGTFFSPRGELVLRQSVSYTNPDDGDSGWNGNTRLAYDYHLSSDGTTRPFVGVSGGRIYGDTVRDSWTAGLEVGSKFFVKTQTYVYAMVSYDWLFDRGSQLDDQFNSGYLAWNMGIGYQF